MNPIAMKGGFSDAPVQSAQNFRALLTALSQPGTLVEMAGAEPPAPLSAAAGAAALVLFDGTTPVHLAGRLDTADLRDWITFHTGAPLVAAEQAMFALGHWDDLQPVTRFAVGTPEYPDRAATLIVEMPDLTPEGATLKGPGIDGTTTLSLPETRAFQRNRSLFPLGFDTYLTAGHRIAGLPRSTLVEAV